MPESKKYTTISVTEGVKADLVAQQEGNDTYSSVIRRALNEQELSRDEVKSRLDFIQQRQLELSRLLVRMAVSDEPLEKDQIPDNLAEYEAWGSSSPFAPSNEQITDVNREEKDEKYKQRALERGFVNRTVIGEDGESTDYRIEIEGVDDDGRLIEGDREEIEPDEPHMHGFSPSSDDEEPDNTDDKPDFLKGGDN
jgi:hypothetical protein